MYAIIRAQGKQFKAEKGKTLRLPRLEAEPGSKLTFEVLLTSDGDSVVTGTPLVGEVKGEKIYVFKFKRRKNYRRKTGHRAKFTDVRITGLKLSESKGG